MTGWRADSAAIRAGDTDGRAVTELASDRAGQADLEGRAAPACRPPERGDPVRAFGSLRCLVPRLRVVDEDDDRVSMPPAEPDDPSGMDPSPWDLELPARLRDSSQVDHVQVRTVAPRSHTCREDDRAAVRAPEERALAGEGSGRAGEGEQYGDAEKSAHARILGRNLRSQRNAFSPVSALPTESVCTSCVPSYVSTVSRLFMWRITGYSSVIPLPPRIERAVRATSSAPRTLPIFPSDTCSGRRMPSSFIRPRWSARSEARLTSSAISASFCCVSWY